MKHEDEEAKNFMRPVCLFFARASNTYILLYHCTKRYRKREEEKKRTGENFSQVAPF